MFGRRKKEEKKSKSPESVVAPPSTSKIETIIGPNAYFRGDVQSDSGARVDGVFEGTIDITGNLVVGEGAKIIADIKANNISISGAIKGDISGNRVEILESGRVWGDLTVNSLLLNEGAYLRGQTTMHGDIEPPMIEAPKGSKEKDVHPASAKVVDVEPKAKPKEEANSKGAND
jgi:cytoskeletal protein CcmA (bactofilin family)